MLRLKPAIVATTLAMAALPVWAQESDEAEAATEEMAEEAAPAEEAAVDVSADTVLATVNGVDITVGHVIITLQALPAQYQALPDEVLFEGILEQLIQQTVLSQSMTELSHATEIQLENERRAIIAGEKIDEVLAEAVTDEALQAAYDEAVATMEPETEYNASHILVETEEEAQALLEELEAGADFAELAMEKSTGPSGPNGGSLGWFSKGMMVQPFDDAVTALEVGEIGGPLQTQFGWHVMILNETREKPVPTLDEMRDTLVAAIEDSAIEEAVTSLVDSADIERVELTGIAPSVVRDATLLEQ